jgi:para-nitrobenzyl esterase
MIGATSGDIGGDTGFMIAGARGLARLLTTAGIPVYQYRFSYVTDSLRGPSNPKAAHASDIPFFFDTQAIKYGPATSAKDRGMGAMISGYITNFAKRGDPNDGGRPHWDRYAASTDTLMDFAADGLATPKADPLGAAIDAAPPTGTTAATPPKRPSPQ